MRGEHGDFSEMPRGGFSSEVPVNVPMEVPKPSKDVAVNLSMDKKVPDIVKAKEEGNSVLTEGREKKPIELKEENKNPEVRRIELNSRIRQELEKIPKDTKESFEVFAEKIVSDISESYVLEEAEKESIRLKTEVHFHVLRDLERFDLCSKGERDKKAREFAIEDSKWMQRIGDRIRSVKGNENISEEDKEKKVSNIWRGIKDIFNDHSAFYRKLHTEYREYNISGDGFEGDRSGILGEVAAKELFELVNKYLKKFNEGEVAVMSATAEEDVDKKIDFFIKVRYKNGVERIIPCQIKTPEFKEKNQELIKSSIIDVVTKGTYFENEGMEGLTAKQKKMLKFKKYALENYGIGFYITIPEGEALEVTSGKKQGKKKKKVINLLEDDGTVADDTKNRFFKDAGSALSIDILSNSGIIDTLDLIEEEEKKARRKKKGGKSK